MQVTTYVEVGGGGLAPRSPFVLLLINMDISLELQDVVSPPFGKLVLRLKQSFASHGSGILEVAAGATNGSSRPRETRFGFITGTNSS